MTNPSAGGLLFQQKILEDIQVLNAELNQMKDLINSTNDEKDKTRRISGSIHRINELSSKIENESKYFFELSNCQHLMLKDNLIYIKKLEQELKELKP